MLGPSAHQVSKVKITFRPRADPRPACSQIHSSPSSCYILITGRPPLQAPFPRVVSGWVQSMGSLGRKTKGEWGRWECGVLDVVRVVLPESLCHSMILVPAFTKWSQPLGSSNTTSSLSEVVSHCGRSLECFSSLIWHLSSIRMPCIQFPVLNISVFVSLAGH